jgi:1-acyl-sn-glycerol-3-phosphate acyltransferase
VLRPLSLRLAKAWAFGGYRLMYRIARIRTIVHGKPAPGTHLFVANHTSYLDILILGHLLHVPFIAKESVRRWPLIGKTAEGTGGFFISRSHRTLLKELAFLQERLQAGKSYILFPEGTSGDAVTLQPFKSAFFQPKDGKPLQVQPISIVPRELNGLPMTHKFKKTYGWRGCLSLLAHVKGLCDLGMQGIHVTLHPPVSTASFAGRQPFAQHLWETIARDMQAHAS